MARLGRAAHLRTRRAPWADSRRGGSVGGVTDRPHRARAAVLRCRAFGAPSRALLAITFSGVRRAMQKSLLFVSMLFSMFAVGRLIADTSFDVSPAGFIATAAIAAACWTGFVVVTLRQRRKDVASTGSAAATGGAGGASGPSGSR
jgi:hypothetical protein